MKKRPRRAKQQQSLYLRTKRKIGKHPNYTCPQIDATLDDLNGFVEEMNIRNSKQYEKTRAKLEKLRVQNDLLREKLTCWREEYKSLADEYEKLLKKTS